MTIGRFTVTLAKRSGVPEDAVQNVWHVLMADGDAADGAEVNLEFIDFYQTLSPYLSNGFSTAADIHKVEFAVVTPGGPGPDDDTVTSPLATTTFSLVNPGGSGTALPAEVAAVLSLSAGAEDFPEESGVTRPAARHRGRIYLGPLSTSAITVDGSTGEVFLAAAFIDATLDAFEVLDDAIVATGETGLGVYSRALGSITTLTRVWMENAPDTQRRRGQASTTRDTRILT